MKDQSSEYINQLKTFLSFPGISSDPSKKDAIKNCSQWLADHLRTIGMQKTYIFPTSTHPVVYAEYITDPSFKTILFYGHYDVQPVDPIKNWHIDPFKAVIKGPYIYGRGASDDKGQLFTHVKAVEQLLNKSSTLSVNIKFLVEGAEEIGSTGLKDFITNHKELLRCNVAVVSDTKMAAINTPAITYSLRGSLNAEVFIQTSKTDLHSGTFGGAIPNAAMVLSSFIHRLHDKNNAIAIPYFYEDVETVSEEERRFMQASGITNDKLLADAGAEMDWGEMNYTLYERTTIRPSLSVTGITSGFQGKGVKNAIPSTASVKMNIRLVPNQRPEKIQQLLDNYIKSAFSTHVLIKAVYSSFANPVRIPRNDPYLKAAAKAYESVFQQKVKLIRAGGTIAAVDFMATILDIPVVLMGFAQAGDNMHAPDEKFYLPNFFKGIQTVIRFVTNVGSMTVLNDRGDVNDTFKNKPYARY
jgi:acetylornithine deacetylase/succinyl-diaminopimelate desuccinylase-like protein